MFRPRRFKTCGISRAPPSNLVREVGRHTQRIQKTLEDAKVKLTEAISDILGTSGRAILKALVTGETDPERLADLTTGRLNASRGQLVEGLRGRVTAHHRFMITVHLTQIQSLETAVTTLEARIGDALAPLSCRPQPAHHDAGPQ